VGLRDDQGVLHRLAKMAFEVISVPLSLSIVLGLAVKPPKACNQKMAFPSSGLGKVNTNPCPQVSIVRSLASRTVTAAVVAIMPHSTEDRAMGRLGMTRGTDVRRSMPLRDFVD
jgi:hypothetical protein